MVDPDPGERSPLGPPEPDAAGDFAPRVIQRLSGAPDTRRDLMVLLIAALAIRLVYLFVIVGDRTPLSDAHQYLDIAKHVADGDGVAMQWPQLEVHPTAFRPPSYPLLLGGWIRIFGDSVTTARLLNVLIGLGVVAMTYVVTRRIGGRVAALVAGGLVAVYPPLLANDATTLAEPLALLLILTVVLFALRRQWLMVGLAGGLLVLTKPAAQGIVVALMVVAFVVERRRSSGKVRWRAPLRSVGTVVLGGIVVVAPWIVRNQIELNTTAIVTSNGFNLMAIYGDVARERGEFVNQAEDPAYQSVELKLLRFDEGRWNDELSKQGVEAIKAHPGYVLTTVSRNVGHWLELPPGPNDSPEALDGRDVDFRHLTLPLFYVVTAIGIAGFVVAVRRKTADRLGVALVTGIALYFTAISLLTVSVPRLRAPFDLACCIGVGLLVAALWQARRNPDDGEIART